MRPTRFLAGIAFVIAVMNGCSQESTDKGGGGATSSSALAPAGDPAYANISPEDAEVLRSSGSNIFGFSCWVADELYFINNGYQFAVEMMSGPDGQSQLIIKNPASGKELRLDAKELLKGLDKGGKAVAMEVFGRMQNELGTPPAKNPNAPPLQGPLFMAHERHQKIRYPELWKKNFAFQSNAEIQQAAQAFREGRREDGARTLEHVALDRFIELGESDPLTQEARYFYYQATGKVLVLTKKGESSWSSEDLTPQEAAARGIQPPAPPAGGGAFGASAVATGDAQDAEALREIQLARDKWKAGDKAGSLEHARKALALRQKTYGPTHPKVAEVQKMIAAAGGGGPN